jgi:hypothetical protein
MRLERPLYLLNKPPPPQTFRNTPYHTQFQILDHTDTITTYLPTETTPTSAENHHKHNLPNVYPTCTTITNHSNLTLQLLNSLFNSYNQPPLFTIITKPPTPSSSSHQCVLTTMPILPYQPYTLTIRLPFNLYIQPPSLLPYIQSPSSPSSSHLHIKTIRPILLSPIPSYLHLPSPSSKPTDLHTQLPTPLPPAQQPPQRSFIERYSDAGNNMFYE